MIKKQKNHIAKIKAKKIETPNVNATSPEESAATFQPIIQHENDKSCPVCAVAFCFDQLK